LRRWKWSVGEMQFASLDGLSVYKSGSRTSFFWRLFRALICVVLIIALSGCDTIYRSAKVVEGVSERTDVRVVRLSEDSVKTANQSPYQPKTLPAVFSATAELASGVRSRNALPRGPVKPPKPPKALELRMPPDANPGPYAIGIGDVVLLSTPTSGSSLQELTGLLAAQNGRQGYTVQDDGSINIPKVGRIAIAGKTIKDAEALLFRKLVENKIEPSFSLEIAEFNSRKISVGGAVGKPTIVPVTLAPIYLDEALAAAGGIVANDQSQTSIRLYRNGTLFQIPMSYLYADTGRKKMRLIDGDAVFVDTQYNLEQAQEYFQQQLLLIETRQRERQAALEALQVEVALLRGRQNDARENYLKRLELGSGKRDYVYLTGEVGIQSRFALPFDETAVLADALFDAGGIEAATGDISQIYVLRGPTKEQTFRGVTAWHLNARNAANFIFAADFELRPKDIIFVAEQPVTRWERAISQMVPSFYGASSTVGN
jgi:polysaccharide export outer membrane protein